MTLAEKLLLATNKEVKGAVEFVSSTAMTITPKYTNSGVTLQYSLDGSTWTTIATDATTPSANIIYFRGCATGTKSLYTDSANTNAWTFTGSTNLECNGKLDRLIQNTLGVDNNVSTIGNYCFAYIFYNGTSLIKVDDDFLPATTLANNCYQSMFRSCTGLTVAPVLPATTLADYCYENMFSYCSSLTTSPELPATTLADYCYRAMFYNCISLVTAPMLPATTLADYCYNGMFFGCTSLVTAPMLPATTLAIRCYSSMFYSCTSLTTAPALPATTLQSNCYYQMLYGCTKIKLSTTLTGIYDTAYRIPTIGTGITATDALVSMFTATGGTFIGTPEINTTYYTENTPA